MDLGGQRAHIGIGTLPIEGHVKENCFSLIVESEFPVSDGWVTILVRVDSFECDIRDLALIEHGVV